MIVIAVMKTIMFRVLFTVTISVMALGGGRKEVWGGRLGGWGLGRWC